MGSKEGERALKGAHPKNKAIQGLRAVCVLGVIFYHANFSWSPGGFVGVDAFFVISGFLISQMIIREIVKSETFEFGRFYSRRIRRLLPTAIVVTLTTVGVGRHLISPLRFRELGWDAISTTLYGANYRFYYSQVDYLNLGAKPSLLLHYWSLAVEEQFYLFWPILIFIGYKLYKRLGMYWAMGLTLAASFAYSYLSTKSNPTLAFYSIPTRAWEFGVGGLAFVLINKYQDMPEWLDPIFAWCGAAMLIGSIIFLNDREFFPGSIALLPVLGTAFFLVGSYNGGFRGSLLFGNPLAYGIGEISYSLYLWHWPVYQLEQEVIGRRPTGLFLLLYFGLTLAFSIASYLVIEKPVRNYKRLALRTGYAFFWGGAATGIAVGVSVGLLGLNIHGEPRVNKVPEIATVNLNAALSGAATHDTPINLDLLKSATFDSSCMRTFANNDTSPCLRGDLTAQQVIVLFGDSHAEEWMPALDTLGRSEHLKIEVYAKAGCPAPALLVTQGLKLLPYPQCESWRAAVSQEITHTQGLALVLLAAVRSYNAGTSQSATDQYWKTGYEKTLAALALPPKKIVLLGDSPYPGEPVVVDCLAHHLSQPALCDLTRESAAAVNNRVPILDAVAQESGATVIDPSSWFCLTNICPAVIGGKVVYADNSHLTAEMSSSLAPLLSQALKPLMS